MPAHSALGKEAANDPPKGEKAVIEDKAGLELLKTKQDIPNHILSRSSTRHTHTNTPRAFIISWLDIGMMNT